MITKLRDRIRYQVLGHKGGERRKIVGIGLPKTGTSSLTSALQMIGIPSIHFPPCFEVVENTIHFRWRWWLGKFDGFTDITAAMFFPEFDRLFRNTRYVLTVRERQAWLDSCRRHFSAARYEADRKTAAFLDAARLTETLFGSSIFDSNLFSDAYDQHVEKVHQYFRSREVDLLELDVSKPDSWSTLGTFLGVAVPSGPFPHDNARQQNVIAGVDGAQG